MREDQDSVEPPVQMPPAIAYAVAGHLATKRAIWVFSALMLLSATMWWFDRDGKKPATEGIPPSSTVERVR